MGVEHTQGLGTTHLYPTNTKMVSHGSKGKRMYGLAVERREKPILGFPLKLFWGKCLTGMTYHPKEVKMSWNHWVHAIGVSKREPQPLSEWECHGKQENKTKLLFSRNKAWRS